MNAKEREKRDERMDYVVCPMKSSNPWVHLRVCIEKCQMIDTCPKWTTPEAKSKKTGEKHTKN